MRKKNKHLVGAVHGPFEIYSCIKDESFCVVQHSMKTCNNSFSLSPTSATGACSRRVDQLVQGLPTDENAAMLHQFEEVQQCPMDEVGTPVLELFLKKDTNGELQQQGTVLSIPPEVLSQAQSRMGRSPYLKSISSQTCLP